MQILVINLEEKGHVARQSSKDVPISLMNQSTALSHKVAVTGDTIQDG